nr:hypothetical protein [Paracoccus saliphilus]
MRLKRSLTAICLTLVTAGAATADCAERLDFMDDVLDQASRAVISASSGGQGVAGAREAQALTGDEPTTDPGGDRAAVDTEPPSSEVGSMESDPDDGTQAAGYEPSAQAGTRVQTLRAAVDDARAIAGEDEAACNDLLRQALVDLLTEEVPDVQPEAADEIGQSG